MSTHTASTVTAPDIRLARALVRDAAKRGRRESAHIEKIAQMQLRDEPEGRKAS